MDSSQVKKANIKFGNGTLMELLRIITVNTPFKLMDFYIIKSDTSFLMLLKNMDRLKVYLNNITNQLVGRNSVTIHIKRK